MAAAQNHEALKIALAGGAAFLGYEFIYKPWKASQDATAAGGLSTGLPGFGPSPGVSTPTILGPSVNPGGVQGSIVDPRTSPGGDVGQAMWKKTWTQQQATDRLNAIKTGILNSQAAITQLQGNTANPAAAGIAAAQTQVDVYNNAIAQHTAAAASLRAAGNVNGAAQYDNAIAALKQDLSQLLARIAAAQAPVDNSAAIAKYQGTIAALKADYTALTGLSL